MDAGLLKELSALDARRHKLTVTLSGDHFYIDTGGKTLDGPLVRGSFGS